MLGYLSTIVSFLSHIISMFVGFIDKIGDYVSNIYNFVTWFIGTFQPFVPTPLGVLVGFTITIMIIRLVVSLGGH